MNTHAPTEPQSLTTSRRKESTAQRKRLISKVKTGSRCGDLFARAATKQPDLLVI